jgi:hypothetical protein
MPHLLKLALAAIVALPAPALAQAADRVLAPFNACRPIGDVQRRAACYDAALDRLRNAVTERQVVIVDKQQAAADRRTLFGLGGSATERRIAPVASEPPVQAIDSTVVSARSVGYDLWAVRLATGATWRTTEAWGALSPKTGQPVRIRRGLMNSYTIRIGNSRALRAVRVN